MGFEYADRLAGLDKQSLIHFEILKRLKNGIERFPVAGCLPTTAVDDQVLGTLSHLRIEVILDHAVGGFDEPIFTGELCAAWGADGAR